jgi:phosphoribosylformylglycinamidine synthase
MGFQHEGDEAFLIGVGTLRSDAASLAGSEYVKQTHGVVAGQPAIDLDLELAVQRLCLEAARQELLASAHDCSRGGLAVAVAECVIAGGLGLEAGGLAIEGRLDAALFGEAPSRIVISTPDAHALEKLARAHGVPVLRLGRVAGGRLILASHIDVTIESLRDAYESGLPRALGVE